ncbi:MAG TPA: hypothetical protein VH560_01590 [Polyangia bacterium]|nr:hypothetical protein [Polyangia bacterium]
MLTLVASCSSAHTSADAATDAPPADASQESASTSDVVVCRCPDSAVITAPAIATNVSGDTCTVTQNGYGPHYSAQTTTGAPCIATFTFGDGGTATLDLTFTRPVGCCGGQFFLFFSGISWQ